MAAPAAMGEAQPIASARGHIAFMVALGLVGWGGLIAATYVAGAGPWLRSAAPLSFCLFLLVIFGARSMAFRMLPETLVSLDSAFYIAAVGCLGSLPAGWLVAVALTLDSLLRLAGADASVRRPLRHKTSGRENLTFVLYFGGMTGGLLMAVGRLF